MRNWKQLLAVLTLLAATALAQQTGGGGGGGGAGGAVTVSGNVNVVQPTGTNLHAVIDNTSAGPISNLTLTGTNTLSISTLGSGAVGFNAIQNGTQWTGTINFEQTVDNVNWVAAVAFPLGGGTGVTSTTTNGQWSFYPNGAIAFRVRGNTITNNASVTMYSTSASFTSTSSDAQGRQFVAGNYGDASNGLSVAVAATPADATANAGAGVGLIKSSNGSGGDLFVWPFVFNGTTWDRNWQCTQSVAVNITTATTTQIVALSGSTVIRVCGYMLTQGNVTADNVTFEYGTGASCGTGTTVITGPLALPATVGAVIAQTAGSGSLFRGASANALCILTSAAGTVTGYVTFAQY
jgi:hypothetical protein